MHWNWLKRSLNIGTRSVRNNIGTRSVRNIVLRLRQSTMIQNIYGLFAH